jgi:photosystem II stability/assembly factor-like uncharacterized protein
MMILTLFSLQLNLFGQWEVLNEGSDGRLNSIDFISDDIGWMVAGMLHKTEDGGLNWDVIPITSDLSIEIIDFLDESNGWAFGYAADIDRNVVLKTEDGGYNWIVKREAVDEWFHHIQALNDSTVFLASHQMILKTLNGGMDWTNIFPQISNGYVQSVHFLSRDIGVTCGSVDSSDHTYGFITHTADGGLNWETNVVTDFNEIVDFQFDDNFMGYFRASNWEENWETFFCQTVNYGQNWEPLYQSYYGINSYFLSKHQTLYLSVFDSLNINHLLGSSDGGKNWDEVYSLANWQVAYIKLNQENKGIILCNFGVWRGGSNSLILTNQNNDDAWLTSWFSYPLNDIFFLDKNRGFSVGGYHIFHGPSGGDVFYTNDGGISWSPDTSLSGWIKSCEFINESVGYMTTRDWPWLVYRTIDSGINWKLIYENNYDSTGFEFYGTDMFVSSSEEVWAVGYFWNQDSNAAGIFYTIDGGESWDFYWKYLNTDDVWMNLFSIQIINNVIWAAGENGYIVSIVDPDSFRINKYPTDLPLSEIYFSDSNHGWISGGYGHWDDFQPLLLKTGDGGKTWDKQEDFPYIGNEFFFRDSLKGWMVGYDRNHEGIILATNNGGKSWFLQADQLLAPLNAIHFIGDYGWAVGDLGQVLKTEDGGASWVDDGNDTQNPDKFSLEQNYPNPFNPRTIINYKLPITNYVDLSIYNLLGQKVVTLVSEKQQAGSYQVEWDASGFASGVYYYRIEAGKFVAVRKMVLLR